MTSSRSSPRHSARRSGVVKDVFGGIVGFFSNLVDGIGGSLSDGIVDVITKPFEVAVGCVKDIINWMIENVLNKIPGSHDRLHRCEVLQRSLLPKAWSHGASNEFWWSHQLLATGGRVGMELGGVLCRRRNQ